MNPSIVYRLLFLLCAVLFALSGKAQLSAADSLFFQSVFSGSRYFNPSGFTGSFYVFDTVHSVSDMTQQIDSQFKFNYTDIAYCDSLQTADTICHPLPENQSFNLYPFIFNRPDPIVALPFTLHQKTARSYAYRYESWMPDSCKTAFMIIPGSHENESTLMTLGLDYANQLCYMQQTMARHGDVYTLIKPNEDHRAIQWNGNRLGNYLIWYLDSANRHYGVNYLIETIAWIKFLKTRYDKVYIAGISEGGYAALLASFLSPGDGSIISGGYTILFDSLPASNAILHERFDSLVDYYHAGQVWNSIQAKTTPFCFTWGDGDPVPGMQTEHDSMLTKNYFSGLANAYSYFNFSGHTFPDCHYTDSVFYTWNLSPGSFRRTNSTISDTMIAEIRFDCTDSVLVHILRNGQLYTTLHTSYHPVSFQTTDTGRYTLNAWISGFDIPVPCNDTISFYKVSYPNAVYQMDAPGFQIQNPVESVLEIHTHYFQNAPLAQIKILDLFGRTCFESPLQCPLMRIDMSRFTAGWYILQIQSTRHRQTFRFIKK